MNTPLLDAPTSLLISFMNTSHAKTILSVMLWATIQSGVGQAAAPAAPRVVIITKDGVAPIRMDRGGLPKHSRETFYLESAVPMPPRPAAPPKPKNERPAREKQPSVEGGPPRAKKSRDDRSAPQAGQPRREAGITIRKQAAAAPVASRKRESPSEVDPSEERDEYGDAGAIPDPIEPVNRGLFWVNHQLYNFVFRPVSKVYTTLLPKPIRTAVNNVYENAEYPVRLVNHVLQGKFQRADFETRKFVVNTVGGVGGIIRLSDHIPDLAGVPSADTGQTFAKWGIGHGPYIVLPILGPRSARDTVGLAGDYVLNPISWLPFGGTAQAVSLAITTPNTTRNLHGRLEVYDAATREAIDPYLALRSAYVQSRDNKAAK
jgi:phospholipid-binding lipoprotein MlaA